MYILYETITKVLQSCIDAPHLQDAVIKKSQEYNRIFIFLVSPWDFTEVELLRLLEFSLAISV